MLIEYLRIIARRWWLVALPVVAVIAVTVLTYRPPELVYQITLRFAAGLPPERATGVYNYDRQYAWLASEYTANGLSDIVRTSLFAENVAMRVNPPVNPAQLQGALVADQKQSIVVVYLSWPDAEQCVLIGNAIISELVERGTQYWPQLSATNAAPVVALDKPVPVASAVSLRDRFDLPLRLILALAIGIALTLLAHALDPFVHRPSELERIGIIIVGRIPRQETPNKQ
jgi:capsular polysaccharide biosynthesis protein